MNESTLNRRSFLKSTTAGMTGMVLASSLKIQGAQGDTSNPYQLTDAWTNGKNINPDIPNMRVVCCHDPKMISSDVPLPYAGSNIDRWVTKQDEHLDKARVWANMDEMAKSLTQKSTASEAWTTIFKKPASKTWAQVKVAMKVNKTSETCEARPTVIGKLCDVLHGFGVPYANIILFDGHYYGPGNDVVAVYSPSLGKGLPADTRLSANMGAANDPAGMGGQVEATLYTGWKTTLPKFLADGTVDILINMAVNKGQNVPCAGFVASAKNHLGTLVGPIDHNAGALISLISSINKSSAIIGGSPAMQQLVVVDSLWTQIFGPGLCADHAIQRTDCLVMGTFSPAVDYLVAKKIRIDMMNVNTKKDPGQQTLFPIDNAQLTHFCTDFGYTESDPQWVEVTPASTTTVTHADHNLPHATVSVSLQNANYRASSVHFPVPASGMHAMQVRVLDLRGSMVRELHVSDHTSLQWDAMDNAGRIVRPGTYIVALYAAGKQLTETMLVQ